jgi:hypothetical protein
MVKVDPRLLGHGSEALRVVVDAIVASKVVDAGKANGSTPVFVVGEKTSPDVVVPARCREVISMGWEVKSERQRRRRTG